MFLYAAGTPLGSGARSSTGDRNEGREPIAAATHSTSQSSESIGGEGRRCSAPASRGCAPIPPPTPSEPPPSEGAALQSKRKEIEMSCKLKIVGLALLACLALSAVAASVAAASQPASGFASATGEIGAVSALIAISLLATSAIGITGRGLTQAAPRSHTRDDDDNTFTTAPKQRPSHTDQRSAQESIRQPIMFPAGAH